MIFKNLSEYYEAALHLSFGCVVILDDHGKILNFQSYLDQIPEKTSRRFIGKKWLDVFSPKDESFEVFNKEELVAGQRGKAKKILTSFQKSLFIEWNFSLVDDSDSTASGILGAGIDVTKHIELEQQLLHADRLAKVGQLAAGIAHEINGPLNNILGYAQLSAKQEDLPEQVYHDLDHIIRFSLHTREVVKKVMLFSRQVKPKRNEIDLNQVIKESLYFIEPLCRQNKIETECLLDDLLPRITGDFSQLRQVVVNLMVNSAQAISDKGGKIIVKTSSQPRDRALISIKDTGMGMSSEILKKCFMPFFTTKDVDQGTGLGLAVVHGIIKSHNGRITAESILGEGSCFRISFPLSTDKGVLSDK
ncbi:MAG: PAS domain S-box protein [Desulfobacteraceae bacterium]|nr:PAS domain S-box protein [Desulfobacteraceae bacterium]